MQAYKTIVAAVVYLLICRSGGTVHVHVFYFGLSQCGERLGCHVPFCSADFTLHFRILVSHFEFSNASHNFGVTVQLRHEKIKLLA